MMRPEEKLLVHALRCGANGRTGKDIADLFESPIDWSRLVETASAHGVMPLLYRAFRKDYSHLVPREILSQFRSAYQDSTARNLLLTAELQKITECLERDGIPAIPYKGPALAAQLYGDIAFRQFVDLDILVRRRDVLRCRDLIVSMGYDATMDLDGAHALAFKQAYNEIAMVRSDGRVHLELQWEVVPWSFCFSLGDLDIWRYRRPFVAKDMRFDTLPPEELLLILCVHGAKDFWGRLIWVCDTVELIRRHPELNWKRLIALADRTGGRRMLLVGMRLARDIFGTVLPDDVERTVEADPMAGRLTRWVKDRLYGLDESPLDFYKKYAFYFRIRERAQDRVEYLFRMIITGLLIEWRPLRLPRSFLPLYYMLRPFRLAKKHGMTLIKRGQATFLERMLNA
jgi:Uncharacterised nucleotidyltransferase